jgi:tRNA nucleotidyltransferase/poly(A) polymerase
MEIFKDEKIKKIIEKLKNAIKLTHFDGKVYIVGGAVRDALLGMEVKDLDIVVEEKGGGIMVANLLAAREKCYVIGSNPVIYETYGTAKVRLFKDPELKDFDIEFVQTRKEQYHKESRNPDTCYGTIEEDAKRRDLTINSLYYNITDGKIYDYNQGIDDLVNQVIRTPSEPDIIFNDDPLRILRVIRFSCRYGWGINKETWLGMIKNAHRISIVSQERITDEISKIITSPNASIGVRKMMYCGILHRVMKDIYDLTTAYESRNPMVTAFDHTMKVLDEVQPFLENRLAALFHDVGSIATETNKGIVQDDFSADVAESDLKFMKFPNYVIQSVSKAIKLHRIFRIYEDGITPPDKKLRKFINSCGDDIGTTLDLMNANNIHQTYGKKKRQVLDIIARIDELETIEESKNVKLPIDGKSIMTEFNLKSGPIIGKLMDKVKDAYFENPNITKDECFKVVEEQIKVLAV